MKTCLNCGKPNSDEAKFCGACGGSGFNAVQQQPLYTYPPKKKRRVGRTVLIIVGVFIALMILGNLFDDPESETNDTTADLSVETTTIEPSIEHTYTPIVTETTTAAPTSPPETTLSDEEVKNNIEFQRQFHQEVGYKEVARNPQDYEEVAITFSGTVIQVMEDDIVPTYRIAQDGDYDQIWYVEYFKIIDGPRILEDDSVTVYGQGTGLITYKTVMGGSVSIPGINSMDIEIHD